MSAVLASATQTGEAAPSAVPSSWPFARGAAPNVGPAEPRIALVLLGTGVVGGALLQLLATPAAAHVRLVGAANSRRQFTDIAGFADTRMCEPLASSAPRDNAQLLATLDASNAPVKVIVDATACNALAAQHVDWLARGYHVVTANKELAGGALAGWRALQEAAGAGAHYGDSATVGAGLPVLSTLRRLRQCGDRLLTVEGVFSGSLSWLFNQYDGSRPFSTLLREARALGLTEPDPREDLSGEDVARKLLIIARSAGFALSSDEVQVGNLVPAELRALDSESFLVQMQALDAPLAERHAAAHARGHVLRHLARINQRGLARVGLVEVAADHPAARLSGTDNQFALTTTRYRSQPLVIQGPGAGPEVTAQALLGDVLALGGTRMLG